MEVSNITCHDIFVTVYGNWSPPQWLHHGQTFYLQQTSNMIQNKYKCNVKSFLSNTTVFVACSAFAISAISAPPEHSSPHSCQELCITFFSQQLFKILSRLCFSIIPLLYNPGLRFWIVVPGNMMHSVDNSIRAGGSDPKLNFHPKICI